MPLTGTGSLLCSSFMVRSRTPDLRAVFLPSLVPPASKMFVISVAMFLRTSALVPVSWESWRNLNQRGTKRKRTKMWILVRDSSTVLF